MFNSTKSSDKNKIDAQSSTRRLTESAVMIALATVFSLVIVFRLPYGGSITLCSMLPILMISYKYGVRWGMFVGAVYGLLQMIFGFAEGTFKGYELGMTLGMIFFDYIAAFAVLGLAGIWKNKLKNQRTAFVLGILLSTLLRLTAHIISGFIFFASYAEWFFSQEGFTLGKTILENFDGNALGIIYSVFYNAMYMIPEILITGITAIVLFATLGKRLGFYPQHRT